MYFCNPKESESGKSFEIEEENEINDTKTENRTFYLTINLILIGFFPRIKLSDFNS